MRVGIYNRWLTTLGGGERYSLALASVLQEQCEVDFLSHAALPREVLEDRFHMDLGNIHLRTIPLGTPDYLSRYSQDYPLFINATQGSSLPCQAPLGVLVVYFPRPMKHSLHYRLSRVLRRGLMLWVDYEGFYPAVPGNPWRYAGKDAAVRVLVWPRRMTHPVTVRLHLKPPPDGPIPYPVTLRTNGEEKQVSLTEPRLIPIQARPSGGEVVVHLGGPLQDVSQVGGPVGVMLRHADVPCTRRRLLMLLDGWPFFRQRVKNLVSLGSLPTAAGVQTYHHIWSISEYTRYWVDRIWGRSSDILFPPANLEGIRPLEKANVILSVGRFFAGGHNKKHGAMVQTFKEMVDEGLEGWELHLAGGTMTGRTHQEYLHRLQDLADGYPIRFHLDLPSSGLQDLYGRARIYWHAAGIDENPQRSPLRFEHFGITVVEAMAGGAVPVVIRGGGLPETVRHEVDGLLWSDRAEWKRQTLYLIHTPAEMERLSAAAQLRAQEFGIERFRQDALALLAQIGAVK